MHDQFAHLSKETIAEIHAAASDLQELIGNDTAFPQELRSQLLGLLYWSEETLSRIDPLVDRKFELVEVEVLEVAS